MTTYTEGSFASQSEAEAEAARRAAEAAPKFRTINLTDRAPVRIREDLWPQIVHGSWVDNSAIPVQSNRGCDIRVRQHADGRAIVYAKYWTRWQGERDWRGGELLAAGDDIAAAILRVGADLNQAAVRECIADLPADELDSAGSTYTWRTDAAHGDLQAPSIESAVAALISQGEWSAIDGRREARDIADGAWLLVRDIQSGAEYRRGETP